jgi:hypothetical protein
MPVHDWTRVIARTWHDFHLGWIVELQRVLNGGLLPSTYYAQAALAQEPDKSSAVGLAVTTAPPRARLVDQAEMDDYVAKRRTLVIRHASGDRIVALLELVSPGNKSTRSALDSFVDKAVEALYRGYHLLIVDLFPPTPRDPQGIHVAIWSEIGETSFRLPSGEPLTLAAYCSGARKRAYVEATAVGKVLLEMPLFLEPGIYINVPLEETYMAAYRGVPQRWKRVLEGASP